MFSNSSQSELTTLALSASSNLLDKSSTVICVLTVGWSGLSSLTSSLNLKINLAKVGGCIVFNFP